MEKHTIGELAYLDTLFNGLIPCKVVEIKPRMILDRQVGVEITARVTTRY